MTAVLTVLIPALFLSVLLNVGLIRRIRTLQPGNESLPPPGTALPDSLQLSGPVGKMTREQLAEGEHVLVALSPNCPGCEATAHELVSLPAHLDVIPILVADSDVERSRFAERHPHLACYTAPPTDAGLNALGALDAFPTIVRIRDGVVAQAVHRLQDLPVA